MLNCDVDNHYLQMKLFYLQANCLNDIISQDNNNIILNDDYKIPAILLDRVLPDDLINQHRKIDNEEMTILGILDHQGEITNTTRLNEFMLLISRIHKVEHRALCIYILSTKLNEECEKQFTRFGGYRLLKRWFELAEEDDCVNELINLIKLCCKLPFDEKAIREANLGKVIKKLKKFKSSKGHDVTGLYTQIEEIMTKWRAKQQELAEQLTTNDSTNIEVESIDQNNNEVLPNTANTHVSKTHDNDLVSNDKVTKNEIPSTIYHMKRESPSSTTSTNSSSSTVVIPPETLDNNNNNNNKESISQHLIMKPIVNNTLSSMKITPTPITLLPSVTSSMMMNKAVPIALVRERKPLDMAESARKLLAMRAQQSKSSDALTTTTTNNMKTNTNSNIANEALNIHSSSSSISKENILFGITNTTNETLPPLKSILKKSNEKKDKQHTTTVQWADENGGILRDIKTIEVEKIKRSTAHYSNTRELSKKERQFEKETHLSKVNDAMQKNTDWRIPSSIVLSIAVLDNLCSTIESTEKDVQDKRLLHVLEVRYLDDSLIPNDPDLAPSSSLNDLSNSSNFLINNSIITSNTTTSSNSNHLNEVEVIPWYSPGTEPTTATAISMMNNSTNYTDMNSSNVSMFKTSINNTIDTNIYSAINNNIYDNNLDLSIHSYNNIPNTINMNNYHTSDNNMQLSNNSHIDPQQFMYMVSQLPVSLQRLDPSLLRVLVYSDASLVQSLIHPYDGSVDETRLASFIQQYQYNSNPSTSIIYDKQQQPLIPQQTRSSRFEPKLTIPSNNNMLGTSSHWNNDNNITNHNITNIHAHVNQVYFPPPPPMQGPLSGGSIPRDPTTTSLLSQHHHLPQSILLMNPPPQPQDWNTNHPIAVVDNLLTNNNSSNSLKRSFNQTSSSSNVKFNSTKAGTPCRFFNTSKGCQFGDKCPFGHFLGVSTSQPHQQVHNNSYSQNIDINNTTTNFNHNNNNNTSRSNTRFSSMQQQQYLMNNNNIISDTNQQIISGGPGSRQNHNQTYGPGTKQRKMN